MTITGITLGNKYISFGEEFSISAKVTMGSSESLAMCDGMPGWINIYLILAHEFYKDPDLGWVEGRIDDYPDQEDLSVFNVDSYSLALMFNPTEEEIEKGESGYAFSDVVTIAAKGSKTFTRSNCFFSDYFFYSGSNYRYNYSERNDILQYINRKYSDSADNKFTFDFENNRFILPKNCLENSYLYPIPQINSDLSESIRPILDSTKRRVPFRLKVNAYDYRETTAIKDIISNTTKTSGKSNTYESSNDVGYFILFRIPPIVKDFTITDNWCKKVVKNPLEMDNFTYETAPFLIARNYSNLTFKPDSIVLDTEVDPTVTLHSCNLRIIHNNSQELVYSESHTNLDGAFNVPASSFPYSGMYEYIYTVYDSKGQYSYFTGRFYAEDYQDPIVDLNIQRISYRMGFEDPEFISDEGEFLRTSLTVTSVNFTNPFTLPNLTNKVGYRKEWTNLSKDKDNSSLPEYQGKGTIFNLAEDKTSLSFSEEGFFTESIETIGEKSFTTYSLDPLSEAGKVFLCGTQQINEENSMPYYSISYHAANSYKITIFIEDYFQTVTVNFNVEETGGILNIEKGGVAVGMRHPNPTEEQKPTFFINYPTTFLQQMILTEGIHFGKQLPSSGIQGQIFYLLIDE